MTTFSLLATKLHQPPLPAKRVRRPHLCDRLNEGLAFNRQMTLVSAPAGFGKTTCITEWLHTLEGWPVCWLSLDSSDDDPGRFFTYFVAALQKIDTRLGQEIASVIRSGQLPPGEVIAATLINDILELNTRFLLVLDDFHVIQDPFILQVLETLVTNLPQPLHLVVLTREDPPLPLARFRANNQLTEIRALDLRFSGSDATDFLHQVMGLSLSPSDIAVLETKTEGWIAGLQLAGLSVRDRANPSGFIATLSGSHRFILSYLTEQVLYQQPEAVQRFLLQTAILDKLNGDLCNAVTGRSDSRALLEQLYNSNLFLIPLDDEQQWYRYHHLFADLLRDLQNTTQKEQTAELHQRASRWYAQAGVASEAIRHALAADDYALAVELLEQHAVGMIMQGYAKTVNNWVQAVPAEWRSQSPRTNLAFAWMHLFRGAYAQAAAYVDGLWDTLGGSLKAPPFGEDYLSLRAEWLVIQALMLRYAGKTAESMAMAAEALDIVPEQDSHVLSLAYWGQASLYLLMEDYPNAVEAYQASIKHGRASGNLVAETMSTVGLAVMAFENGQLHLAYEIAEPFITRIEQSDSLPPISAVMYGPLAEVCYQWFQIEQAQNHAAHALRLSTLGGYNTGAINCRVLLSRIALLAGDLETAASLIQDAVDRIQIEVADYVRQEAAAQQVKVYLARNRPDAARMALQAQGFSFQGNFSYPELAARQSALYSRGALYNSSLRFLLYQAYAGRDLAYLRAGIDLASRVIDEALQSECIVVALEALLLRAQMVAVLDSDDSSLTASHADYVQAVELAEPEGFIGVFIEQGQPVAEALASLVRQNRFKAVHLSHIERILSVFSAASGTQADETAPAALFEPLTDRELEVLSLMAEGLKYKEIAARLFITVNTVRYHVKTIYGKLDVNSRAHAIAMARQLHIL